MGNEISGWARFGSINIVKGVTTNEREFGIEASMIHSW